MTSAVRVLVVASTVVAGCGPAGVGPSSDAGPVIENAFALELGTGREVFRALDDGDTLHLEAGFQGAQHVLASVRVALPEGRYLSDFTLVRADGTQLSEPSRVRVPFAAADADAELLGYRVVVGNDDVDNAVDQDATLRVVVEDDEGGAAEDERSVHVVWAPEGWDPDAE